MKKTTKMFNFLSKFIEDFFIVLGMYFISKSGFLIAESLGFALVGLFSLSIGVTMLIKK